jgi:hypothetical protein
MKGVLNLKIKFKIPKFLSTITDPKYEDSKKYLKLQKTLLKNINSDCLNLSCENLSHKSVELINAYIQENQS